jgi:hypothetical protein
MKAKKDNKRNCWIIEKGKTVINIFPGQDRPFIPIKIEFEGKLYEIYKYGLIEIIKGFESTYSEEQVLEQLIKFTCD